MLRVKLHEKYPNQFWNSGNGVTIHRNQKEGVLIDENNAAVALAIEHNILEVIPGEESLKEIITDTPSKQTIKEVVGKKNQSEIQEALKKANTESKERITPKKEDKPVEEPKPMGKETQDDAGEPTYKED